MEATTGGTAEAVMGEMAIEGGAVTSSMRCTDESAVNENPKKPASVAHSDDSGDRDSLAESLTLSDEKSLCDSFTSLDTLDQEVESEVPPEPVKARPEPVNQAGSLQNLEATIEVESAPVFRRQRWETRSMTNLERSTGPEKLNISVGGWSEAKGADGATASDLGTTSSGQTKGSFVRRRDLWEKRTSITSTSTASVAPQATPQLQQHRPKHTPDLVMDLPPSLPLSSSPKEGDTLVDPANRQRNESGGSSSSSNSSNSSSPSSPDMTTAAETFAMQNQSTLKKSTIKQIKKDRADAAAASASGSVATTTDHVKATPVTPVTSVESARPTSSVKVSVSAYGSASVSTPVSNLRPVTPKIANRFPHHINLYATPMPVLPVAFAAEAAAAAGLSPADPSRPQLKIKPQVLKKPTIPASLSSPESSRRSELDHDSHV